MPKLKEQSREFDQFFTRDAVALDCLDLLLDFLKTYDEINLPINHSEISSTTPPAFLEPSAGDGAFLRALKKRGLNNFFACDIAPKNPQISKLDFLTDTFKNLPPKNSLITIGNPPFGKRARLAAAFINRALFYSDLVAFILPLQFQKYSAQNKILPAARLVFDQILPENAFVFNGKDYPVRCCFQIWTTRPLAQDLRLRDLPITRHADFEMWQYNNTREAEKYFDRKKYAWDFAVPRQGYKDYCLRESDPEKMDHHTQWIFFKAKNQEILERLLSLDFEKLSKKNISIPGFGKADVISEYEELYGTKTPSSLTTNFDKKDDILFNTPLGKILEASS